MNAVTTQPSLEDELTAVLSGERLSDPWPVWDRARDEGALHRLPQSSRVVVTRYADVKTMMLDGTTYSNKFTTSGSRVAAIMKSLDPPVAEMLKESAEFESLMMSRTDDPLHARLRNVAHKFFTPKYLRALEPVVQGFIDDLLAEHAQGGGFDNKRVSQDLALRVMTHIIGAPQVDRFLVRDLSDRIALAIGSANPDVIRDAYLARQDFNAYIEDTVIAAYRRDPHSQELAAALMGASEDERLSEVEMMAMIANLLFGGLETTAVLLTGGLIEMLEQRSEWEKLLAEPAKTATAVEELLRWVSPAQWMTRIATRDLELGGEQISEGQTIIGGIACGNRDPRFFEDADKLNVGRKPRQHLGLGTGPHYCLGASLIRLEARLYFGTLLARYPGIEMAVRADELSYEGSNPILRAVAEMPVVTGAPA
jgi:cytochrome P450